MIAAYLLDPGRSGYDSTSWPREQGIELEAAPAAEGRGGSAVCRAEGCSPTGAAFRRRLRKLELEAPVPRDRAAVDGRAGEDGKNGVKIDAYRMGEITARLTERSPSWKRAPRSWPASPSRSLRRSSSLASCSRSLA